MIYYGVSFTVKDDKITNCCTMAKNTSFGEMINETIDIWIDTMIVKRFVVIPTDREYTAEEAEALAKEWWKKFREQKILEKLEGE